MEHRALGPLSVSVLALGSWRTWERIPRGDGVAVLRAARELGVDFLETARYHDFEGRSEVIFGEIFRGSGWPRDAVTIANKLWWERWPEQTVAEELEASLARTGLDHFDFIYSDPPPAELGIDEVVALVEELVTSGRVRAWGVVNWPAERIAEARSLGSPVAAQLPYSLVQRSPVEDADMVAAMGSMAVVASFVLAGGALTGKYRAGGRGRLSDELENPRYAAALREAERLRAAGEDPLAAAISFAVRAPRVACVLLGATSVEQVRANVAAIQV